MEGQRALHIGFDILLEKLRYKPVVIDGICIMIDSFMTVELFCNGGKIRI